MKNCKVIGRQRLLDLQVWGVGPMRFLQRFTKNHSRRWRRGVAIACGVLAMMLSLNLGSTLLWGSHAVLAQPAVEDLMTGAEATPESAPTRSPVVEITDEIRNLLPPVSSSEIERGVVRFDGRALFFVANTVDQEEDEALLTTHTPNRANQIERALYDIVRSTAEPQTLDVQVREDEQTGRIPIIYVGGDRYLMSVTLADAQVNNYDDIWALAYDIRERIQEGLDRYELERQPEYLTRQGILAGIVFTVVLVASGLIYRLQRRLQRKRNRLNDLLAAVSHYQTTVQPGETSSTSAAIHQEMTYRQRRTVLDVGRWVTWVAQCVIWGSAFFVIVGFFPYTRWLQAMLLAVMPLPLQFLALLWATQVLLRLGSALVDRFFLALQNRMFIAPESSQRIALRFSTFSQVTKSILTVLLISIALLVGLSMIGIQIAPLLAGAGILGLGISFASQSLIKDIINGFFILLEDQYGVGDVVVIGDVAGLVENMNLRITQLRNEEGRLITIPNNTITVVQNLSKEWSRVDLKINVAPNADIDEALALIKQVAQEMTQDPQWRPLILEPPSLLGIDDLTHAGVMVRLWIKTQPLKQWDVAREYRRRLKKALDAASIHIGVPQQLVSFQNAVGLQETLARAAGGDRSDSDDSGAARHANGRDGWYSKAQGPEN